MCILKLLSQISTAVRSQIHLHFCADVSSDTGVVIYEPSIVGNFTNKPIVEPTPDLLSKDYNSTTDIQRVESVHATLSLSTPAQAHLILQKCLLSGLSDSKIGLYSKFHEVAIYMYGYDSQKSIRIADMYDPSVLF